MKYLIKLILKAHVLIIAIAIIMMIELLALVSSQINLLDNLEYSIEDFDYTDLHYSGTGKTGISNRYKSFLYYS